MIELRAEVTICKGLNGSWIPNIFLSLAFPLVALPSPIFFSWHHVVYLLLSEDQQQHLVFQGNFSTGQVNQHPWKISSAPPQFRWQRCKKQQGLQTHARLLVSQIL
jgi:hypothetical protein